MDTFTSVEPAEDSGRQKVRMMLKGKAAETGYDWPFVRLRAGIFSAASPTFAVNGVVTGQCYKVPELISSLDLANAMPEESNNRLSFFLRRKCVETHGYARKHLVDGIVILAEAPANIGRDDMSGSYSHQHLSCFLYLTGEHLPCVVS